MCSFLEALCFSLNCIEDNIHSQANCCMLLAFQRIPWELVNPGWGGGRACEDLVFRLISAHVKSWTWPLPSVSPDLGMKWEDSKGSIAHSLTHMVKLWLSQWPCLKEEKKKKRWRVIEDKWLRGFIGMDIHTHVHTWANVLYISIHKNRVKTYASK